MLGNVAMETEPFFALLLIGLLALRRQLKPVTMAALDPHIETQFTIDPRDWGGAPTISDGIKGNLGFSGRPAPFSMEAIAAINQASSGNLRMLNNLALEALMVIYLYKSTIVGQSAVQTAAVELGEYSARER